MDRGWQRAIPALLLPAVVTGDRRRAARRCARLSPQSGEESINSTQVAPAHKRSAEIIGRTRTTTSLSRLVRSDFETAFTTAAAGRCLCCVPPEACCCCCFVSFRTRTRPFPYSRPMTYVGGAPHQSRLALAWLNFPIQSPQYSGFCRLCLPNY